MRKRPDFSPDRYLSRIQLLDRRSTELALWQRKGITPKSTDADTLRFSKRLFKLRVFYFTFLDKPNVPFDNNLAKRAIPLAVILQMICQFNRAEQGGAVQVILMSIHRPFDSANSTPPRPSPQPSEPNSKTEVYPPSPFKKSRIGLKSHELENYRSNLHITRVCAHGLCFRDGLLVHSHSLTRTSATFG